MTRRNTRAGLEKWFVDVDHLLAAQQEHAISQSTVPSARTDPATWTMTLGAFRRDLVSLIDLLVGSPGRWIFILEIGPRGVGRYVQLLVCEDGSIVTEASSNNYLEGSYRLSSEQEAALVAIGWKEPCPPDKAELVGGAGHHPPGHVRGRSPGSRDLRGGVRVVRRRVDHRQAVQFASTRQHTGIQSCSSGPVSNSIRGTESTGKWSDAFHRSRLSPVVFVVAKNFVEPVRQVHEILSDQIGRAHV